MVLRLFDGLLTFDSLLGERHLEIGLALLDHLCVVLLLLDDVGV